MDELMLQGRIAVQTKPGRARLKRYLDEMQGRPD